MDIQNQGCPSNEGTLVVNSAAPLPLGILVAAKG